MNILTIENGELRLNSNLDEYAFGKTNYNSLLDEQGVIFDGKNFLQWSFEEIKSFDAEKNGKSDPLVFYCAKNPISKNAKTLAELLNEGGKKAFAAAFAVCNAITNAAQNELQIPLTGAGGILVELTDIENPQNNKILFAPEKLFEYSANSLPSSKTLEIRNGWLNDTLKGIPALCFERAAIVYKLLSGNLPFENENAIERNSDILDQNFLPLEYCINGIDPQFCAYVNNSLKLHANSVSVPGKKTKGKTNEALKPSPDFPLQKLEAAYQLSQSQIQNGVKTDFAEKAAAYKKAKETKIKTKRRIRRNSTTIAVSLAIILTVSFIVHNTIKSRETDFTSTGLNSVQTIQAFMKGVNDKDVSLLTNISKGKNPEAFSDSVGRVYVIHKQRIAYGNDNGFANPENWLLYITEPSKYERSGIYGITQLKIDGNKVQQDLKIYKHNENPEPVVKENGLELKENSQSVHQVEYFMLCPEGEVVDFTVEKCTDIFTLTYTKNRWIITDIKSTSENLNVNCNAFKEDYFEAVKQNNGDAIKATESLRTKYEWLPETQVMQKEKERIDYQMAHPYEALGF